MSFHAGRPIRTTLFAASLAALVSNIAAAQVASEISPGTVRSKDGTTIAYEQSGSGPAVVLVMGALSGRSGNARLAALLAPHFTVVNYDRRGRGQSGDTPPYAVDRELEDIEALIDRAGGSAFIFGSSSGAALALEATRKLPTKISRQVLFEPPFIIDDSRPPAPRDFVARVNELVASGRRGDAVEYFMTQAVGVPAETVAQMKESPMWAGMEKLAHTLAYDGAIMADTQTGAPLSRTRWASVAAPTLVLDGEKSDAFLRNAAQAIARLLPSARHRTLEGQDHSAVFTAPNALAPVLSEFFLSEKGSRMTVLCHQVWINAPAAKVYEGLSTAEGLGRWWAPHTSTQTDSGLVLSHDPGPAHGPVRMKVLERAPDKRVEWEIISTHPSSSPASAWTGTRISFEVSERANIAARSGFGKDGDRVAVLEFRHSGWDEKSEYLGFCNFAWATVLQMLKNWCESQSG